MLLRRTLPAVLAVVALAGCPSVDRGPDPDRIAVATFDPTTGTIPTPNDLALQRAAAQSGLQRELLLRFVANGGWPSDQEVPVNIPVSVRSRQADGSYGAPAAPGGLDLTTVNDDSVAFVQTNTASPTRILRCPTSGAPTATCWEPSYANGLLTLRRNGPDGHRRWDAGGRYVIATRDTIRSSDGLTITADQAIALIAPNQNLTHPEFQPPGASDAALATVEQLRGLYATGRLWSTVNDEATCRGAGVPVAPCWLPVPAGVGPVPPQPAAFEVVSTVFPSAEMASIQTFTVAGGAAVQPLTDSGSGQLPLPSDFLLDPATGRVRNVPAFGPLAGGLATLDGFSTTAPLLMPLTGAVKAATITPTSALLFEVTTGGLVPVVGLKPGVAPAGPPQVLVQPPPTIDANGLATAVVLAPAVEVTPTLALPPLKEKTQYLVVLTSDVKDAADQSMRRSTLMDIVFSFSSDICEPASDLANCTSRIPGVSNADAAGLQRLRASVKPALQGLGLADCSNNARCAVLAYTVKTQTVTETSLQLAAAPYQRSTDIVVKSATPFTPPAAVPVTAIETIFNATVQTINAQVGTDASSGLATGALDPNPANWKLQELPAMIVVPKAANVTAPCPAGVPLPACAPLVVFEHGLGRGRLDVLAIANTLAAQGFVVAAMDQPFHGDRTYCSADDQCAGGGTCNAIPELRTPVDAVAPGKCSTDFVRNSAGIPAASGNFFVSANLFRLRDGMRQDVLDTSSLILAIARPPTLPAVPANGLGLSDGSRGFIVNPAAVYLLGQSQGAINGTVQTAVNPRVSRSVLNVGGATYVDIATTSPSLAPRLQAVLAQIGISPGTPQYAQFLSIAKWVLDPADPVNYGKHLFTSPLPNLLAGATPPPAQTPKEVFGQIAQCDGTIPNPTNRLLFANIGLGTANASRWLTTYSNGALDQACSVNAVPHGFLLDGTAFTPVGQRDAAFFLRDPQTAALVPARTTPTLP